MQNSSEAVAGEKLATPTGDLAHERAPDIV